MGERIKSEESITAARSAIRNGLKDDAYKNYHLRILDRFEIAAWSVERKLIIDNAYKDVHEMEKARSLIQKISSLVRCFVNPFWLDWRISCLIGGLVLHYSVCQYIDGNVTQEQLKVIAKTCHISQEQFKVIERTSDNPAPTPPRPQKTKKNLTQCQRIENLHRKMDTEFEISKLILNEVPEFRAFIKKVLMMLYHWSCRTSSLVESLCLKHDRQEQLKVIEESCQHNLQENVTCSIVDKLKTKIRNLQKVNFKEFEISKLIRNEVREVYASAIIVLEEYLFLWCRVCSLNGRKLTLEKQKTRIAMIKDSFRQFDEGKITQEQLKVILESSVKVIVESPSHHHLESKDISVVLGESLATGRTNQVNRRW